MTALDATAGTDTVVRLSDLRFRWSARGPWVLDLPHLAVQRGERLFIGGPSGSGKSSLLGLLAGVSLPREGELEIVGQPLARLSGARRDRWRADRLGYVFQLFNLLPYLSLIDNVTLPCRFSRRRRARAAAAHQGRHPVRDEALRLLDHLGMGRAARTGRAVAELSVGEQQRVAAARALIGAPDLLIADEPTSALDQAHRERFLRLLFRECAAHRMTLILVSHDLTLAPLFDRALWLPRINRAAAVRDADGWEVEDADGPDHARTP